MKSSRLFNAVSRSPSLQSSRFGLDTLTWSTRSDSTLHLLRTSASITTIASSSSSHHHTSPFKAPCCPTFPSRIHSARRCFSSSSRVSNQSESISQSVASQPESAVAGAAIEQASTGAASFLEPLIPVIQNLSEILHLGGMTYSHAISIVLVAFAARATITLPVTLWQRARSRRMVERVLPAWNEIKKTAPYTVRKRCRLAGKSYEEYQIELKSELKARLSELMKVHNCSPLPTFLAPLAVNVPLFIVLSTVIRYASLPPSPFSFEILPWWEPSPEIQAQFSASAMILAEKGLDTEQITRLQGTFGGPTLSDKDSTMMGPIALGLMTMTNVELGGWTRRTLSRFTDVDSSAAEGRTNKDGGGAAVTAKDEFKSQGKGKGKGKEVTSMEGEAEEEPARSRILTNALRVMAIGFIPIASQAPGALLIYWLSSGAFTLGQNVVFAILDSRRLKGGGEASSPS
ncbi:hypothetical protein IE53DRAFT_331171 [Violaceomyces palustris]|uniref:Uncharacterized protein n=1 Tax=Violaceomyces palustris TaxID=1673888 RepID=A0ACD0NVT2_9BASI|nr:hypothetical protein IE53DRAFT_331171 [Violaceomyces palustris]